MDNRVYDNSSYGILAYSNSQVQGNTVYSNGVGIYASSYFSGQLLNNLVYANATGARRGASAQAGAAIVNNTVYQPLGDAVQVGDSSQDLQVRNNILWVAAGYDLDVATDSQQGFQSDYNDLYATGGGAVGSWQGNAVPTLNAWQAATQNDADSLASDPLFVSPAGADGILGYGGPSNDGRDDDFHLQSTTGSYHGGSLAPVVDVNTGLPTLLTGTGLPTRRTPRPSIAVHQPIAMPTPCAQRRFHQSRQRRRHGPGIAQSQRVSHGAAARAAANRCPQTRRSPLSAEPGFNRHRDDPTCSKAIPRPS